MSANTTLGPNTLDNFGHGNNYSVTSHSTAMDIFSVEAASKPHLSVRKNGIPLRNISAEQNGHATNGTTKIYDPNEDSCSLDDDTMETTPTPNFISTSQENKNEDWIKKFKFANFLAQLNTQVSINNRLNKNNIIRFINWDHRDFYLFDYLAEIPGLEREEMFLGVCC